MKEPKIVHIMADGKRLTSVKGHVIPKDSPFYKIVYEASIKGAK